MDYQEKYKELLTKYTLLETKVEGFSSIKQDLINMRSHIDKELEIYKRLQFYTNRILNVDFGDEILHYIAEAFIDILEIEFSVVVFNNLNESGGAKIVTEGIRTNQSSDTLMKEMIAFSNIQPDNNNIVFHENELQEFSLLSKNADFVVKCFKDADLSYEVYFGGGNSIHNRNLYPAIGQREMNLFQMLTIHFQTLISNSKRNEQLKKQYRELFDIKERLQESQLRFKDIVYSIADWVWEVNKKGQYTYSSIKSKDILGYAADEILGKTPVDFMPKEEGNRVREIFSKILVTKGPIVDLESWYYTKEGKLVCLLTNAVPLYDSAGNMIGYRGVDRNITQRREFENEINKAIIKTQEDERFELGSELHDNVLQILAANSLLLNMLESQTDLSTKDLIHQCKEQNAYAITELRSLSHRLAPVFFENKTLEDAIRNLIALMNVNGLFTIHLEVDELLKNNHVKPEIQIHLYRIVQEQLKNIIKYSKAKHIRIGLHLKDDHIYLRIEDDGIGFDIEKVQKGIGLANIKRRTELFTGRFQLNSSPGKGCLVDISIPLQTMQRIA